MSQLYLEVPTSEGTDRSYKHVLLILELRVQIGTNVGLGLELGLILRLVLKLALSIWIGG